MIRVLITAPSYCIILRRGPRDLRPRLPFLDETGWHPQLGDQFIAEVVVTSEEPEPRARLVRRLGGTRPQR
jgi:hypothetical protein